MECGSCDYRISSESAIEYARKCVENGTFNVRVAALASFAGLREPICLYRYEKNPFRDIRCVHPHADKSTCEYLSSYGLMEAKISLFRWLF